MLDARQRANDAGQHQLGAYSRGLGAGQHMLYIRQAPLDAEQYTLDAGLSLLPDQSLL